MRFTSSLVVFLFAGSALTPQAQTPPPPSTPKPTSEVAVAPLPNYDETKVGTYTLPDALTLPSGKPVHDAETWYSKRRPEIVELFESQQYGRAPGRPAGENFEIVDKGTPSLKGKAIRKQVTIYLNKEKTGPAIDLLIYLPADATKPVPMFFSINFGAVQNAVDDPGIIPEKVWDPKTDTRVAPPAPPAGHNFGHIDAEALLAAGFGVATYYYGDIDPDYPAGFPNGIRVVYQKPGETSRAPDDWGSVAAWGWGMSRVQDYFETDKSIDARRVAIHGISRLGKTVMWAGAHDQRFAAVIASCSGEGGAALSHRNFGETIANLTDPTHFAYQFAPNYAKYGGFPDKAPMDANLLVALIAPRPLLLQTGSTDDWSDPKGEFLSEVAAGPVYKLLGREDLGTDVWPAADHPIFQDLSYFMHNGGHGMVPSDWAIYIEFLKKNLQP